MPQRPHSDHCECRACLCDCGTYRADPREKCHPECSYSTLGQASEHEYPPADQWRITYW
jgi:hypothetical protein